MRDKLILQANVCRKEKMILEEKKQKNECCHEGSKLIKGIVCDVRDCAYHDGKSDCYAGTICVGPCEAGCSANTSCATFKPKEC